MPPYLTCISLISNTDDHHRTLDLVPGKPHIVGRASRNKDNMRAASDNALFDCAVISREHAEIRWSPFSPARSVTITDKKSLHGTTVNGRRLMPNSPFTLKTGDVITFGERVSRGAEAHDGVSVTFHHLHQVDSHPEGSYRPTSPYNIRGFHVPDDSEQSDFDSEVEFPANSSHERSSATTTPEQPKVGSQNQPIDLDNVTAPQNKVISLLDGEEESLFAPEMPKASQPPPRSIVPESISMAEESITFAEPAPVPGSFFDVHESDIEEDDNDNIIEHNTGLSQVLIIDEEQQPDEEADAVEIEEYFGRTQGSEHDADSWDSSPEPSDDEVDDYVSDEEESASLVLQRQQSEELGEPSMPAQKPSWLGKLVENAASAPKPRYDPVRSSQPPEYETTKPSTFSLAPPAASTHTYAPWSYGNLNANMATDSSDSTRWDLQPESNSHETDNETTYVPMPQSPFVAPPTYSSTEVCQAENYTQRSGLEFYSLPQTTQTVIESSRPATAFKTASSTKGKLSIDNLVEPQHTVVWNLNDTRHASQPTPTIANESAQDQTGVNKRKAADVEDNQTDEPAAKKAATVDAATGTQRAIAVPARRCTAEHSLTRRIAGAALKHAASATVGAAATVAFLNSTYAEQLIQYLS